LQLKELTGVVGSLSDTMLEFVQYVGVDAFGFCPEALYVAAMYFLAQNDDTFNKLVREDRQGGVVFSGYKSESARMEGTTRDAVKASLDEFVRSWDAERRGELETVAGLIINHDDRLVVWHMAQMIATNITTLVAEDLTSLAISIVLEFVQQEIESWGKSKVVLFSCVFIHTSVRQNWLVARPD
jgi:hypothetical protein